ncbi:MAG: CvpA family protein [bacterium]|nr:CvpA family protein [bacterium]
MHWLDIVFAAILAVNILIGLSKGIIRELFPLAGLILGILIAARSYEAGAIYLTPYLDSANWAKLISFTIILTLIFSIITLIGYLTFKLLHLLLLGWADRAGGAVFGAIKGIFIVCLIIILLAKFPFGQSARWLDQSLLVPHFLVIIKKILLLLPEEFSSIIGSFKTILPAT